MSKTSESFCCHEKATKYDEYDVKFTSLQDQEYTRTTSLSPFQQNISKEVLQVDVLQYLKDNWPLDDSSYA